LKTLPDYLRQGLEIVSIGLNPSLNSVSAGFYFATPQNRFWKALNASTLIPEKLAPGKPAVEKLFHQYSTGFTDVVRRPTAGGHELKAKDFREGAPALHEKLMRFQPHIAWFHGKQAYRHYLKFTGAAADQLAWGEQRRRIGITYVFVTPNPSPANARFSLEELVRWYRALKALRDTLRNS